jgi:glycosyltransferase involved in cell wall biosynthesis
VEARTTKRSPEPLNVLIVAPWAERAGGAEQMLWSILRCVDPALLAPEVAFLSSGPLAQEVRSLGFAVEVLRAQRLRNVASYVHTVAQLARLMRRRRHSLVVSWSAKTHLYAGLAAAVSRTPSIWWQHAIPSGHWIDRLATLVPARAVGCSSNACAAGQRRLRPRRRTFVVHPGVGRDGPERSLSRSEIGLPEDAFVVGVVGRLQPWKGQDAVIRATGELRRRGVPARALVVGGEAFGFSRGYGVELRRLAHELGLAGDVVFAGQVPDARPYYGAMDVCVNASDSEPFGIAVIEAMAAGVPVVARKRGGPAEIIENGRTGLLVDDDLVGALMRLAHDRSARERLGEAARSEVERRFSAVSAADALARELSNLASAPGAG